MPEEEQQGGGLVFAVHGLVAVGLLHGEENLFDFRSLLAGLIVSVWDGVIDDE